MMYNLPTTLLGRTGLRVTRLGIGGGYCQTADGYRAALDCGVNYLDTARSYRGGEDERVIGEALVGRRERVVLATKTVKRTAAEAREELEASLRLLRTDYVDVWQLHYVNTPQILEEVLSTGGAMEAALRARQEGLTRFLGVTGHDWPSVAQAAATGLFDVVLCWYNCAMKEPEEVLFPTADRQGMGVVIMQATRNTKLLGEGGAPPLEDFFRYVLSHPSVHVVLMGLRRVEDFAHVARALAERATLDEAERQNLEAYGRAMREAGKLG